MALPTWNLTYCHAMECAAVPGEPAPVTWSACGIEYGHDWTSRETDGSEPSDGPENMPFRSLRDAHLRADGLESGPHYVDSERLARCIADAEPVACLRRWKCQFLDL